MSDAVKITFPTGRRRRSSMGCVLLAAAVALDEKSFCTGSRPSPLQIIIWLLLPSPLVFSTVLHDSRYPQLSDGRSSPNSTICLPMIIVFITFTDRLPVPIIGQNRNHISRMFDVATVKIERKNDDEFNFRLQATGTTRTRSHGLRV